MTGCEEDWISATPTFPFLHQKQVIRAVFVTQLLLYGLGPIVGSIHFGSMTVVNKIYI